MAKKFAELRGGMIPAAQARTAKEAERMLAEIASASSADKVRNLDEVIASLPVERRANVERRARELASSSKLSARAKKKRTAKRRSRASA
jgi:hypothetical protein